MSLAPVTHILPVTYIRRERVLPVAGKVLVRKGQKVSATDTIVEADLVAEHLLLDIPRALGITVSQAEKQIKCQAGDDLNQGDVIAGPVGFTRRIVRVPTNGKVVLVGNGQVLIEVGGQPFQIKAGVPGEVTELIGDRGAVVETTGALIQGIWGNGKIEFGLMTVLLKSPDHVLTPDQLDVSLRGSIILAGYCEDAEVFRAAEELPLRGLILSGMAVELIPQALQKPFSIIVLDGFSQRPMNSVAYKLLSTNDRREVAMNAEAWDTYAGTRPEVVIPLPGTDALSMPKDTNVFAPDKQVRVLRAPHAGVVATLVNLSGVVAFPGGLRAQAAEVRLETGELVLVPLSNLEVLE